MKFILFMMKQCDPTIPSLDVLKRFIMPDFVAPLKVRKKKWKRHVHVYSSSIKIFHYIENMYM